MSDGTLSPTELVRLVADTGLRVVSLTDHDTTAGIAEALTAATEFDHLTLIPGVELSVTHGDSDLHLTCHFVDVADRGLQRALTRVIADRTARAEEMVHRLSKIGIEIDWDALVATAGDSIGRPHIARQIVALGRASDIQDAFGRYLNPGGHAYVPRAKFDVFDALDAVHQAGGVATVAHPRTARGLHEFIGDLARAGLAGIEVYAEKYDAEQVDYYAGMAVAHGLTKSGGTDYHANQTANETQPGMNGPPPGTALQLYERAVAMHGSRTGAEVDAAKLERTA